MLTGSVEEHVLVFGYGTGRNGKTLVVQTLLELLGDYATTIPASLLMDQRNEQHPTEVARLMGRRVAIGSETERGKRWAEAKLKSLTGGDRITARFMRQDYFEFTPQFKILLVGNAQPNLRNVDVAMRRRLHLLPFEVTVPEERVDPDLPRKLREEGPAILRWMIEGTLEWRRTRLKPPAAVLDATDDYFTEQDTVGLWLAECTEADPHAFARSTEAYGSFQSWCEQNGEPVRSQKWLSGQLKERGIQVLRMRGGSSFAGLRVDKTPGQTGQTP
jgi:putative DNA primase/helicase